MTDKEIKSAIKNCKWNDNIFNGYNRDDREVICRDEVCDYIAEFINHEYSTDAECEMVDLMIKGIQHMSIRNQAVQK